MRTHEGVSTAAIYERLCVSVCACPVRSRMWCSALCCACDVLCSSTCACCILTVCSWNVQRAKYAICTFLYVCVCVCAVYMLVCVVSVCVCVCVCDPVRLYAVFVCNLVRLDCVCAPLWRLLRDMNFFQEEGPTTHMILRCAMCVRVYSAVRA
jgi:hypothetical protein